MEKKITYHTANDSSHLTRVSGVYFALHENAYAICIKDGLNNCWKRMVLAKELFHVLFDHPEFKCTDVSHHTDATISSAPIYLEASPVGVQQEFLAEYAAMEFLFPYQDRIAILGRGEALSFQTIAENYKIPRIYVERYLSSEYITLCASLVGI